MKRTYNDAMDVEGPVPPPPALAAAAALLVPVFPVGPAVAAAPGPVCPGAPRKAPGPQRPFLGGRVLAYP